MKRIDKIVTNVSVWLYQRRGRLVLANQPLVWF